MKERLGNASPAVTTLYTKIVADECADEIRDLPRWWRERAVSA